jgi:drug/metabolite transporter (DMT)-like permease
MQKYSLFSKLALLTASLIWGSSFFIMKNTVDVFPMYVLLAIRFTIGCGLLCLFFFKRVKKITRKTLSHGTLLGVLLFAAYTLQTLGLKDTTPGKNAFLTAIYCIVVPFLFWMVTKKRPDVYNCLAGVLCLGGIGLVSLTGDFSIGMGDALTMVAGIIYAVHIVVVARVSQDEDPVLLTLVQFGAAAVCCWAVSLATETFPVPDAIPAAGWYGLLYLAVFATTGALLMQNIGQKYTHPAAASILLSLESVFGIAFSMVFYGEKLTLRLAAGFLLIFFSVIVSETKLGFLRKLRIREKGEADIAEQVD